MNIMKRFLTGVFAFLLFSINAFAQTTEVTGKVTDASGVGIPNASVKVKGTKGGDKAGADGTFKINLKPGSTLIVSAVGFETKEIAVTGTNLTIKLEKDLKTIGEVVVTALGQSTSKIKTGYSTTTISSATINKNAPIGVLDGLAGKVAGVDISNSGGPGSSTKVILRGYGTIAGADNAPLYVIDGVPMSNARFGASSGNLDFGNGLNTINPADVESVSLLKGTAASSLYGGLAKNGVILITTKKGKSGKLKIEYTGSANFSEVGKLPDFQDQFGQGWGGVFVPGENGSWGPRLDGVNRLWGAVVDNSQLLKPFSAVKDNLRKFYDIGSEINNTLSLSGGNDVSKFYFSYGNLTSDGVVPTKTDYLVRNTFTFRSNSTFDKFYINTAVNYINQRLNVPNTGQQVNNEGGGVFESLLQIPVDIPITDFKDYKNKFFNVNNYFTPYAENPYYGLNENGDQQKQDRILGNIDLGYKFTKHLSADVKVGGDFTNARTFGWNQPNNPAPGSWNAGANTEGASRAKDVGSVYQGSDFASIINTDFIVKYENDLNKNFNLSAIAGGNYYEVNQKAVATQITNLTVPGFFNLSNTTAPPTASDARSQLRRFGVYAQGTIGYKGQLFLTANIRNDWSSTLPIDHNSIFYPGANLSWIASQLLKENKIVSFLKLRTAYGRTGSDPGAYNVYPRLGSGNVGLGYGSLTFPFNGLSGFGVSNNIASQNLKPIFTDEFEAGAEVQFLKNRIGLDFTFYNKVTKGQIFNIPVAPSTGYTSQVQNLGTVRNRGVEITLTAKPLELKNFSWTIGYTYTKNDNKVLDLNGGTSQNPVLTSAYDAELRAVVGGTVAAIYAPVPQMTADGKTVVDASTGLPVLNTTPLDKYGNQKGFYGNGLYDYSMGLTNTFTYKNFQLNFSFDFRHGGVMYSGTADLVLFTGNGIATTYNDRKPFIYPNSVNAVTDANGNVTYVENKTYIGGYGNGQNDNTWSYYYPSQNKGSAYANRIIDKSFLKLRDINLSYNLPAKWASKIKASAVSVAVYGRNFLVWTPKSNVYIDPEATNLGNDITSQLGEFRTAPVSHNFGASLKVTF